MLRFGNTEMQDNYAISSYLHLSFSEHFLVTFSKIVRKNDFTLLLIIQLGETQRFYGICRFSYHMSMSKKCCRNSLG